MLHSSIHGVFMCVVGSAHICVPSCGCALLVVPLAVVIQAPGKDMESVHSQGFGRRCQASGGYCRELC